MNDTTVISFSLVNSNVLSKSDCFALPHHSISYDQISYRESEKVDMWKAFDEISMIANNAFVEVEEIGQKVGTIRLFINSLLSTFY